MSQADPREREKQKHIHLQGEIADPSNPPKGYYFHPRCKFTQQVCREQIPELLNMNGNHQGAYHFAEVIKLSGII